MDATDAFSFTGTCRFSLCDSVYVVPCLHVEAYADTHADTRLSSHTLYQFVSPFPMFFAPLPFSHIAILIHLTRIECVE